MRGDPASKRFIIGWLAVAASTLIASGWAFWGIVENFHEGWYRGSLSSNLALMLVQYLGPMLLFSALALLAISSPRAGGFAHMVVGVVACLFLFGFRARAATLFLLLPLLLLGALYWYGRPHPRRSAGWLAAGLPLLTLLVCGLEPALRVAGRLDDGDRDARLVEGNGVRLVWAPDGAGWPRQGVTWPEAVRRCLDLTGDGTSLADLPQSIWRLPTVDEAVRSMARHGSNSGGVWDSQSRTATYRVRPDKESPLWNTRSQVIYWWTADPVDSASAFMVAYDGQVWPKPRDYGPGNLGFRCVKPP
jgi:hypothetical protein